MTHMAPIPQKLTGEDLIVPPCELCRRRKLWRSGCNADDSYSCGIYWDLLFEQWDATCKLIYERTGKRKKK